MFSLLKSQVKSQAPNVERFTDQFTQVGKCTGREEEKEKDPKTK